MIIDTEARSGVDGDERPGRHGEGNGPVNAPTTPRSVLTHLPAARPHPPDAIGCGCSRARATGAVVRVLIDSTTATVRVAWGRHQCTRVVAGAGRSSCTACPRRRPGRLTVGTVRRPVGETYLGPWRHRVRPPAAIKHVRIYGSRPGPRSWHPDARRFGHGLRNGDGFVPRDRQGTYTCWSGGQRPAAVAATRARGRAGRRAARSQAGALLAAPGRARPAGGADRVGLPRRRTARPDSPTGAVVRRGATSPNTRSSAASSTGCPTSAAAQPEEVADAHRRLGSVRPSATGQLPNLGASLGSGWTCSTAFTPCGQGRGVSPISFDLRVCVVGVQCGNTVSQEGGFPPCTPDFEG